MSDDVRLVHRGPGWLVAWKPAGLPVDADPALRQDSFRARLAAALRLEFTACHPHTRLDQPVAGLTLWSLEPDARRRLVDAGHAGRLRKLYLALASRAPAEGQTRLPAATAPWRTRRGRPLPEPPATRLVVLHATSTTTLVAAGISAGKWHQIRLHLAHHDAAALGDRLHGGLARFTRADGAVRAASAVALECVGLEIPEPDAPVRLLEAPRGVLAEGAAWLGLPPELLTEAGLREAWRRVWLEPNASATAPD